MTDRGRRLLISAALFFCATGALLAAPGATAAEPAKQQVVVHLSHYTDDLHAVSMALKIGRMLTEHGASVTMFADLEGVRLGDARTPQGLAWGSGKPVSELYAAFIEAGGQLLLCPHCSKVAGIGREQLRNGASIATEAEVAELFLKADKVIDY